MASNVMAHRNKIRAQQGKGPISQGPLGINPGGKSLGQHAIDFLLPKGTSNRKAVKDAALGMKGGFEEFRTGSTEQDALRNLALQQAMEQLQQQGGMGNQQPQQQQMSPGMQAMQALGNAQFNIPQPGQSNWTTAGNVIGGLGTAASTIAPFTGPAAPYLLVGGTAAGLLGKGLESYGANQDQQNQQNEFQQAMAQLGEQNRLNFEPLRQQAMNRFEQETMPSIAARFGALGGHRSSAFNNAVAGARGNLAADLAAMQQNANVQNQGLNNEQMRIAMALMGQNQGQRNQQQQFRQNQQQMAMDQQRQQQAHMINLGQLGQGQQHQNLQQQIQNQARLQALMELGMQPQIERHHFPGQPGLVNKALGALAEHGPKIAMTAATGVPLG